MSAHDIVRTLSKHLSPGRLSRLQSALSFRLADTALVFENVGTSAAAGSGAAGTGHNLAACLRTADAMGIQRVHVIERWGSSALLCGGVDKGSGRWASIHRHATSAHAVDALRQEGYTIFATDLGQGAMDVYTAVQAACACAPAPRGEGVNISRDTLLRWTPRADGAADASSAPLPTPPGIPRPRVALVFGNEHRGCSKAMLQAADFRFFVPQAGFVQSMNISVACAVATQHFLHRTPDYALLTRIAYDVMQPGARASQPDLKPANYNPARAPAPLPYTVHDLIARDAAAHAHASQSTGGVCSNIDAAAGLAPGLWSPSRSSPSAGACPPLMWCEMLSDAERDAILARWLLSQMANAELILERAGCRPDDL